MTKCVPGSNLKFKRGNNMVCAGCHAGNGIICLDEKNASAACNRNHLICGWAQYPDITYIFRTVEMVDGSIVSILKEKVRG